MWGLAQGPNSCADLIVATPGIEPPTLRVQVKPLCYRLPYGACASTLETQVWAEIFFCGAQKKTVPGEYAVRFLNEKVLSQIVSFDQGKFIVNSFWHQRRNKLSYLR